MKKIIGQITWILYVTIVVGLPFLIASTAVADAKSLVVKAQVCHGANYVNGGQVSDYANTESFLSPGAFAFWQQFLFPDVGVIYDGTLGAGVVVTPAAPPNSIMSTISKLPPRFDSPQIPFTEPPPGRPIHNPKLLTDTAGNRGQIPLGSETSKLIPYRNDKLMGEPITLERWNKARGLVRMSCNKDGTGS